MKIIVDRNTAVKAVCELLNIPCENILSAKDGIRVIPYAEISFDFEEEQNATAI